MLKGKILTSVGSVITGDGMVYPLNNNNEPDMNMGVHITECTNEWMESLSDNDYNRVINHGFDTCMHGNSWNSECSDCNIDEYLDAELAELEFIGKYESGEITDLDELL